MDKLVIGRLYKFDSNQARYTYNNNCYVREEWNHYLKDNDSTVISEEDSIMQVIEIADYRYLMQCYQSKKYTTCDLSYAMHFEEYSIITKAKSRFELIAND